MDVPTQPLSRRPLSVLRSFLDNEAAGGLVLMAAAALALVVANSPLAPGYFGALHAYIGPLSVRDGQDGQMVARRAVAGPGAGGGGHGSGRCSSGSVVAAGAPRAVPPRPPLV